MRDIFTLFLHVVVIVIRLARPGGFRSVIAESVLLRHQVVILNRGRKRAPNLRASDRIIIGLCTLLMRPVSGFAFRRRLEAIDSAAFSQTADEAEIPPTVFAQTSRSAWTQRADESTDRRCR